MSETVNDRRNISDEDYYEVGIVQPNSVCENSLLAPSSCGKKMTSFVLCKKIPLSRKWRVIEVKVMTNTIWHSEFKLYTWVSVQTAIIHKSRKY